MKYLSIIALVTILLSANYSIAQEVTVSKKGTKYDITLTDSQATEGLTKKAARAYLDSLISVEKAALGAYEVTTYTLDTVVVDSVTTRIDTLSSKTVEVIPPLSEIIDSSKMMRIDRAMTRLRDKRAEAKQNLKAQARTYRDGKARIKALRKERKAIN